MAARALPRTEIKIGEGMSTAIFLALLLASVTGSIDAANWADGLGILTFAVFGGLLVGIVLAKLPLRGLVAHSGSIGLSAPALTFFATLLLPNSLTFKEKLLVLQERFLVWFSKVAAGREGGDNLWFVIQLAFVMWVIAYAAAWFIYRRHQVWGAILPSGIAIVINLFYAAPQNGLYFSLYLLSALLLLVRLNLHTLERWWRGAAIGYASDISFDFLLYGGLFAGALLVLIWLLPASVPGPSWFTFLEPLQTPWQNVEDQFTRVFSALRAVARPSSTAYFGSTLTMGGPVQLGQQPVMDVTADAGRYWRATGYDKYTGIGWLNTHVNAVNLSANDARLEAFRDSLRVEVTQTIKLYLPDQNILFAAAQPLRFDVPTEIRFGESPASDPQPVFDLALVRARRPMQPGESYQVASAITIADEDSLRADTVQYSAWISETYLQLPDSLPPRVRNLALSITDKSTNPYDKAAAIENYLRTKIKYNDQVSAPPAGRDGVDYTLFDRPEGYCNYYASAMAVMLRTIGIPARVASGYTLGDYASGTFHVVEANAHAWPEVYFPTYGWIEFEPTANKPAIVRPQKPDATPNNPDLAASAAAERLRRLRQKELEDEARGGPAPFLSFGATFWNDPIYLALAGGGAIGLLAIGALGIWQWRRARMLARLAPAAHVYENLLNRARWLGVREQKHATPLERARAISDALPDARGGVARVAALYAREKFGARQLNVVESAALSTAWSQVSAAWRRALLVRTIERIVTPPRELFRRARVRVEYWRRHSG